jgi:hypothetical protein
MILPHIYHSNAFRDFTCSKHIFFHPVTIPSNEAIITATSISQTTTINDFKHKFNPHLHTMPKNRLNDPFKPVHAPAFPLPIPPIFPHPPLTHHNNHNMQPPIQIRRGAHQLLDARTQRQHSAMQHRLREQRTPAARKQTRQDLIQRGADCLRLSCVVLTVLRCMCCVGGRQNLRDDSVVGTRL